MWPRGYSQVYFIALHDTADLFGQRFYDCSRRKFEYKISMQNPMGAKIMSVGDVKRNFARHPHPRETSMGDVQVLPDSDKGLLTLSR